MSGAASILIVDDDDDICGAVGCFLELHGYEVVFAHDGIEALQMLDGQGSVRLILVDLMMPGMSGDELIRALRESRHAALPLVVMSGQGNVREQARRLGVHDFLLKPVEPRELLDVVQRFADPFHGASAR